jgi:hypothetical protein
MDLSELIEELREIAMYESDPQDWMGYLESDDSIDVTSEFVY